MRAHVVMAGISLSAFCALATMAGAATAVAGDRAPAPRSALTIRIAPLPRTQDRELPLRLEPYSSRDSALLSHSAERARFSRYRVEGMDVLGGGVWGTLDGSGARVYLRWPPDDD